MNNKNANKSNIGKYGEEAAKNYLIAKGYKIIAQNYRFGGGEVDIIAKDNEYIVFIEVKYRRGTNFGNPADAITLQKQQKIINTANEYLLKSNLYETDRRYDTITIFGKEKLEIEHTIDAFWATS